MGEIVNGQGKDLDFIRAVKESHWKLLNREVIKLDICLKGSF